ncbi:MAG TPA: hypothetical protein VK509_18395, partial [Polyangiales bacterium]|nr:hypothetical protein [Polyangiales bacterium]
LGRAPELPQVRLVTAISALPASRRRVLADALVEVVAALGAGRVEPQLFFEDAPSVASVSVVPGRPRPRARKRKASKREGSERHGR